MKPLAGIRVIELARVLAGPWCGQLLADLGAEVIKIERPGTGDDTRQWGPPFVIGKDGENLGAAYFHAANRGKSSVAIDLATPEGQADVKALVAESDVLIENYKVGALARYGLDYASLLEVNPSLVYCSITGFGQNGPHAGRAGYDYVVQGIGGFMSLNGEPDRPPQKAGVAYADIFTGVYSAVAILAALRRRDAAGSPAHIDMALLDTQISVLANQGMNWLISGEAPSRMGNAHPNLAPYEAFATRDGDFIVAVGNDGQFGKLCDVLEIPLATDARFRTNAARVAHRDALRAELSAAITRWSKQELADALEDVGIPAGPINRINEAFADEQVVARGLAVEFDGIPGIASPIVIDDERMVSRTGSPRLGRRGALG